MKKSSLFILVILLLNQIWASADAIGEYQMRDFINQCGVGKTLNLDNIEKNIILKMKKGRETFNGSLPFLARKFKEKKVVLNGYNLENIEYYDLLVLSALTSLVTSFDKDFWYYNKFDKDKHTLNIKERDGVLYVKRTCKTAKCIVYTDDLGLNSEEVDLSKFNSTEKTCQNAYCAAKQIFGPKRGALILWAFLEYKSYLSPYNFDDALEEGLTVQSLYAILVAYAALPKKLLKRAVYNKGFYLGHELFTFGIYANASGIISHDLLNKGNLAEQSVVYLHELGHRAGIVKSKEGKYVFLHESKDWLSAANWISTDLSALPLSSDEWPSGYAKTNAGEDFAETFNMYRMSPRKLLETSPSRYQYFKENIFDGLEYLEDICNGSIAK